MQTVIYPAKFESLNDMREQVGRLAREGGFSEKDIYSIQLATDEGASNIIEHACEGMPGAVLELSCELQGNSIVIILRDQGHSFDPSSVKQPDITSGLAERQIGGLGIFLMKKLMDDVRYQSTSTGNVLTMKKRKR